ncbi:MULTISPECIES: helix-turn-helix domain-containing protein [unclassified Pseudomonas]|jgi:DNA-binding XRE family transcriptional regulator|uniref:helix-turn-helix domain-containing protein n=1 Tax=Pseudomonas TaxID=286 RepID=UPI000D8B7DC8|nr:MULTISPECIES: helix-turn-helix transcriptional regulator [unclassified Pseudomonas]MDR2318318.1 helix-turn-helix domain-containing protein [Pseudomonas sp.]PYG82776.1 helix-turn-helix protein [Pseudomonas sp. RV120224-01c]PYG85972.1 helix-turn-helix protein [Pseudomonas sp. RV120224-01b]
MSTPTNVQIINDADGRPAFVVLPYADYIASRPQPDLVPNEVVGYMVKDGMTAIAAWRRHLDLTQAEVAQRLGISQSAYAQQETAERPRKATREKIAAALGIPMQCLDL